MKTIFIILLAYSAQCQVLKYHAPSESIAFINDTLSVEQSFKILKKLVPSGLCAHTRYVIKNDKIYMRKYYVHNSLYRKTYIIENTKKPSYL